jgi:large subunit ribosomal protein L24
LGATLDKKLREKCGMRSVEVRKGDEVKVMRGKFAKKQGKVGVVDVKHTRIQIDGLQRAKMGGEKVETWFHPSNVKIIILNTDDKKRMKRSKVKVEEKKEEKKVEVKKETKPVVKKVVEKKTETKKKVEAKK